MQVVVIKDFLNFQTLNHFRKRNFEFLFGLQDLLFEQLFNERRQLFADLCLVKAANGKVENVDFIENGEQVLLDFELV